MKNNIKDLIYEVRGKKVIMDSDLANLYKCTNGTKDINKAVKRNINKFSENCYFKLTDEEYNSLRFHRGTLNENKRGQHKKYLPYVFTKEGIKILSTIIKSAKEINTEILNNFKDESNSLLLIKSDESTENIRNLIYEVRGKQVMMDYDLARLYECTNGTKTINLAVKRHINRFPERFMFQLTKEEYHNVLRFQFETLELEKGKYSKYLPYAFTEEGVSMLATVLRTKIAEEISVRIMDAFVAMRRYIGFNESRMSNVETKLLEHDSKINYLQETLNKFEEKKKVNKIYFNGQIFDAYSKILEIFKNAKIELVIIDSYADNTILDIIKRLKIKVTIITKENNLLTKQDIEKYNKQYHNLKVIYNDTFHDRYFILDKKEIYHCGASINRIGYKTFSITLISDKEVCESLINKIKKGKE